MLAGASGIVAFGAGPDAGGSILDAARDLDATGVVLAVAAVAAIATGLVLLARRRSGLLTGAPSVAAAPRPAGPPVGSAAPAFTLPGTSGNSVSLAGLLAPRKDVLLVFFSPSCGPCARIAPELGRWQREFADRITVAVLSTGTPETVAESAATYGISEILVDENGAVARAYARRGTPGAIRLDANGVVVSPYAAGDAAIGELLLEVFGVTEVVAAAVAERDSAEKDSAHAHDGDHEHANAEPERPGVEPVPPDAIDATFVPVARADVTIGERDGETVLVDRASGAVHLLNPTAAIVWQCLDGSGTIDEIAADIADVFEQDASDVGGTVVEVVRRFGSQGLLVGVGVPAEPAADSAP
jgi:peroxiredoxin